MASAAERIAAFAYHDVTDDPRDSGFHGAGALPFKLGRTAFARHLDAIAETGARPQLVTAIDCASPGRTLLLTFDDGGASAVHAGDELCRRGWRGHFFIVTGRIGARNFLDAAGIRYLRACGHVVGSHSHSHPHIFREQTPAEMAAEWRTSRELLADLLGEPCTTAAVPGGDISRLVLQSAAAAGFQHVFTCEPTLAPARVGGCWVLGRFSVKATTTASRIRQLAGLRGWERALLVRRLKNFARMALPGPYRQYVRWRTT
jgi:peptidoglycan/xylan/chitin deacetylase (PgdA/CDA1 family)